MAARFWVGSAGTWNNSNTANWSATTGGTSGASAPTSADDVTFDALSGTGVVTTAATAAANSITYNSSTLTSLTLGAALNISASTSGAITLTAGTINLATFALTGKTFSSSNSNTRAIQFGTGNITTTSSGTVWTTATATNLTYTGTPTVNISNNSATATTVTAGTTGGAATNVFNFNFTTGTYALTISSGSYIGALNFTGFTGSWSPGTASLYFYGSMTLVSGMTFTTGSGLWIPSNTTGTLIITSAGKTLGPITSAASTGATVQLAGNTTLASTAAWGVFSGTFDLNNFTLSCGSFTSNNSNTRTIAFGTTGQVTITGNNATVIGFATTTNLSITGTVKIVSTPSVYSGTRTFLISSTAGTTAFSVGSGTSNQVSFGTTSGDSIAIGGLVTALDFTGYLGTWAQGSNTMSITTSSLTLDANMTCTASTGVISFTATSGTQSITSAGKTINPITINGVGDTVQLQDALTLASSATLTLTNGTFNANNFNVTTGLFSSNNSNTRTITMGSGTWTLSGTGSVWDIGTTTNLTFNKNTANIVLSDVSTTARTFAGGGLTYNNLTIGGSTGISTLTITGANTFDTLASTKTVAHTIVFPNSTTTVNNFTITGTVGNVVTLSRTGASGTWTISKSSGGIISGLNYLSISNSTASPISTWYAGANSTDGGGNTNWIFTVAPINSGFFFFM